MYSILIRHRTDRVCFRLSTHNAIIPDPSQRVGSSSLTLNTRATVPSSLPKSLSATSPGLRQTGDPSHPDFATTARHGRASETSVPTASPAECVTASFLQQSVLQSSHRVPLPEP